MDSSLLSELIQAKLELLSVEENDGYLSVYTDADKLRTNVYQLRQDPELAFDMLSSVTCIDYLDHDFMVRPHDTRFVVVYHFLSLSKLHRLRLKVCLPESRAELPSLTPLYASADCMESEVWDMYGIEFSDHPNLRRVLMYPEFKGHPLRKNYPVQKKQPRVQLRYPEVENTARLMNRAELVTINKRKEDQAEKEFSQEAKA